MSADEDQAPESADVQSARDDGPTEAWAAAVAALIANA